MACFLIVASVTGSVIAFYDELDRTLNPHLYRVVPRDTALDAPALIERAEARVPEGRVTGIILRRAADESVMVRMEPRLNPATGEAYVLDFTELYLDSYTGEELAGAALETSPKGSSISCPSSTDSTPASHSVRSAPGCWALRRSSGPWTASSDSI